MTRREWLMNLLFPPKCPFCGRVLDGPGVCPSCEKTLPWTGSEKEVRELGRELRCAAPLWYTAEVRKAVLRFKFGGHPGAAKGFGPLVARCAETQFPGGFEIVTWAPVSRQRRRERGYDQGELLARETARAWGKKPVRLLRKIVHTPAQSGMKEEAARRANVLGVYEALPEAAGRRVLLIDDVCTTGATLRECARVLREAGAAEVVCAALAGAGEKK